MKLTTARAVSILCVSLLIAPTPYQVFAQQQPAPPGVQSSPPPSLLTADQLASLVAPIALYPDPILSQLLVASTYPLEIVEAQRWLTQNATLKGTQLAAEAAKQSWDASVQALVALPDLLNRLNKDIGWTSDLGNAFLAQQADIMQAVQRLRVKAKDNGALQTTPQQQVTTTTEAGQTYIEIQPPATQVVYIPEYNPEAVWGPPEYPYPPIYYPPYDPGAVIAASAISFGVGVAVGAIWSGGGGWGWNCGWGHNNVVINNNFINNNHFNRVNVGNGNNWVHNPAHRGAVPYNNRNVANQFNGNRVGGANINNISARPNAAQVQQRLGQTQPGGGNLGRGGNALLPNQGGGQGRGNATRPAAPAQRPAGGDRVGNRNIGGGGGGNHAFSGVNQGGNRASMNSSRGSMSRGGGGGRVGGGRRR